MDKRELSASISQKIGDGKTQEAIYSELLASGESVEKINEAYESAVRRGQPTEIPFGLLNVIFVVGGLSAAIAVLTAVFGNWDEASVGQQTFSLTALSAISYVVAYTVDKKSRFPAVGTLFYFIGALLLGSAVLVSIAWNNDDGNYWQLAPAMQALILGATALWSKRESMWPFACVFILIMAFGFVFDEGVDDSAAYTFAGFVATAFSVGGLIWIAGKLRQQADSESELA